MNAAAPSVEPCHIGVPYGDQDELVELLRGEITRALRSTAPVLAVLDGAAVPGLRAALGPVAEQVRFADPASVHDVPGFTLATRWARMTRGAGSGRPMVISQHLEGLPGCELNHWPRLDIGLDVACAGLGIDVLCPYLAQTPAARWRPDLHPFLLTLDGLRPNPTYRRPAESVIDFPPPPPPDLGPPAWQLTFAADDLGAVRHGVGAQAAAAGLGPDRVADLVLAVNELVSNSVEHGPGHGRVRVFPGRRLVVEVSDTGRMGQTFPGMTHPPPNGERGRGLWLASELCDVLEVWSDDPTGTVVRVHTGR